MFKSKSKITILIILTLFLAISIGVIAIGSSRNKLEEKIMIEAGTSIPSTETFIINDKNRGVFVTDIAAIDTSAPGTYTIEIDVNNKVYTSLLEIVDTTEPTGEAVSHEIWANEALVAENFVTNIADVTDVTVAFEGAPDFSTGGSYDIGIVLTDTSGNTTLVSAPLTIIEDTETPVIVGAVDQVIYEGETISYKKGVTVTDNRDEEVNLNIDNSNATISLPGEYEVVYSAIDSSGNESMVSVTITVKEKTEDYISQEDLDALCDQILGGIITEDMSDYEKLYEIFYWTRYHIAYTGHSDKGEWRFEAGRGIEEGNGDCFTYFAVNKALLNRAGFENIDVARSEDANRSSDHYWSLVQYEGGFYHYDSTPLKDYSFKCLLRTDDEVAAFSEILTDYYAFDSENYPETPVEILEQNQ